MKTCPNCHASISELAMMCPYCRQPLSGGTGTPPPINPHVARPQYQPQPGQQQQPIAPGPMYPQQPKKKSGGSTALIVILSFLLGIGVVVGILVFSDAFYQEDDAMPPIVVDTTNVDSRTTVKEQAAGATKAAPAPAPAQQTSYSLTGTLTCDGETINISMNFDLKAGKKVKGSYGRVGNAQRVPFSGTYKIKANGDIQINAIGSPYGSGTDGEAINLTVKNHGAISATGTITEMDNPTCYLNLH